MGNTENRKIELTNLPEMPYAIEEALNRLRINVSFLGSDIKKIMVISSVANEGKSFVTSNIWMQMAKAGSKSVFVDADIRNSVLMGKYGMEAKDKKEIKGLSYYLSHDCDLKDVLYQTNIKDADIIPNVENVINPSLLLENGKFEKMLGELEQEYKYVFVDTPPLGLVSDGEKIATYCDGAILVVRGGHTSKRLVKNSIQLLERAGCPLLGIVLNRANANGSGGYYFKKYGAYGKGYGYGYYGDNAK